MRRTAGTSTLTVVVLTVAICLGSGTLVGQPTPIKSSDTTEQPAGESKSMLDFVKAGGPVGYIIILLSMAGIALVVEGFFRFKPDNLLPPLLTSQAEQLAYKRRFTELLSLCKASDTMFGRIVASGMSHGKLGLDVVREAMQEVGLREITRLHQRVGYIGFIASIAPMLGLLGTVTGMIGSFNVLGASKGAARPDELAVGISEAMVTTCMGLVVAVPLMFFHSFFRNRVTRIGQEASGQCERLILGMTAAIEAHNATSPAAEPQKSEE